MAGRAADAPATGAPALWAWLLAGAGLDAVGLSALRPVVPACAEWPLLQGWALMLSALAVAWAVHVGLLPALFGVGRGGLRLVAGGAGFVVGAGVACPVLGTMAGGAAATALLGLLALGAGWPGGGEARIGVWAGMLAGAAGAGAMLHAMRPGRRAGGPWRARSDVGGAVLAMGVGRAVLLAVDAGSGDSGAGGGGPGLAPVLLGPLALPGPAALAVLGTAALLPHLVLLGLDARAATVGRRCVAGRPIPLG